jgi:hypothetical protein
MSPVGDSISSPGSGVPHGVLRQLVLQKLKPASGLHDSPQDFARSRNENFPHREPRPPSRSCTAQSVPFRYSPEAPRLDAAFVAQLLGQLMPGECAQAAACNAYGGAPIPRPAFDKKF